MHDGELGTGQGAEGYLVTGLGVEDVAVVDVGFISVHVVVAKDVLSAREVGVVTEAGNANSADASPIQISGLGDFKNKTIDANYSALNFYAVVASPGLIDNLEGQGPFARADEGMRIQVFTMKE